MIEKQKLISWMYENGYDFHKGSYDSWLEEFHKFVDSEEPEKCKWEPTDYARDEIGQGQFHTISCLKSEVLIYSKYGYIHCPYCGREIEEVESGK